MSVPVIDSHVHMEHAACMDYFKNYRREHGFDYVNFACICGGGWNSTGNNLLAAAMKLTDPHFFAHGGLYYPEVPVKKPIPAEWEFGKQARELIDMGFDGIKMLETKPTTAKAHELPVSDAAYEDYFAYLERTGTHVVWHACDPETFWDADTAPAFSFQEGWFYGDGTFPTKEQIYRDVFAVLDRHPNLNATFAHFFFLSDFPDEAVRVMEKYPNISFDITPGREMYDYFTRRRDTWKAFFTKYADRIVFGTDMTSDEFQGGVGDILTTMRRFLATEDVFRFWDFEIRGLGLATDAVAAIEGANFARMVAPEPKAMDKGKLGLYVERALPCVRDEKDRAWLAGFFEKNL
ncbi:MAG: amidohydrolase family protein [Clostridiaceae bacterium]|nr:amidohydrolase family protein [Clostridiaceae bacterium]